MLVLGIVTFVILIFSQWLVFYFAPVEKNLGVVQKIFYLHMPFAWWAFVAFFFVFWLSCSYLIKGKEKHYLWAGAFGEVGVFYSSLVLITGIFWAKSSWNTWWTWDPRLTTALIMWFCYVVYLVLRTSDEDKFKTISSSLGIVAFLDVPLVFLTARMWRSIHPAVFSAQGGMDPRMEIVLLISFLAWGLLFIFLCWIRAKTLKIQEKIKKILPNGVSHGEIDN